VQVRNGNKRRLNGLAQPELFAVNQPAQSAQDGSLALLAAAGRWCVLQNAIGHA